MPYNCNDLYDHLHINNRLREFVTNTVFTSPLHRIHRVLLTG